MTDRFTPAALAGALVAALALGAGTAAAQGTLDKVKEQGKLVVGVKADYKPYGYIDPSGNIVGIEPDLAKDVADDLGVELELVPVVASNRMQFLEQGRIDLMIATMTDTPERREVVHIVEPNYYSSGVNIIAPKGAGIGAWEDLRGKPVCGIQGAFYNKSTAQDYGAEIVAFTGTAEALNALQQGRCVAFVYDDAAIVGWLQDDQWADYEMPLETIDDQPWGLAVRKGDDEFAQYISDKIKEWHKSGRILELETEYGVENTPFARRMHEEHGGSS
jgi:polar amino acid transport system substrate-binding protein